MITCFVIVFLETVQNICPDVHNNQSNEKELSLMEVIDSTSNYEFHHMSPPETEEEGCPDVECDLNEAGPSSDQNTQETDVDEWTSILREKLASREIPAFIPKTKYVPEPVVQNIDYGQSAYVLVHEPNSKSLAYECDRCGEIQRSIAGGLIHSNLHCQYQYPCKLCNKEFYNTSLLTKHENVVHSIWYECDSCDKKYVTKRSLQRHKNSSHN